MERLKKVLRLRYLLVFFVVVSVYVSIGRIYAEWLTYSFYYQTSAAAKFLMPLAPSNLNLKEDNFSPFGAKTPVVTPELQKKHGSYKNYRSEDKNVIRTLTIVFWLPICLVIYIILGMSWIVWLLTLTVVYLYKIFLFICYYVLLGGWLKGAGLLP